MANPVFRGAGRLASNAMFGRSNSLSINTGAANSTLYASSSPSVSSPQTQVPCRSGPTLLIGPSIYSKPFTPGPSNLRNEWKDKPSSPPPNRNPMDGPEPDNTTEEAQRNVSNSEAPWLGPNWKPPAGPVLPTVGVQAKANNNNVPPPVPQPPAVPSPAPAKPSFFTSDHLEGSTQKRSGGIDRTGTNASSTDAPWLN